MSRVAASAIAAVCLVSACGGGPPPMPPPPVSVAAVLERDVTEWDDFTGRLKAVQSVEIRPRIAGYIEKITFREGGIVKVGDPLFVIDPQPFQAEAERARAQLESARARADLARQLRVRADGLLKEQAISQEEYDERASTERQATEDVRAAQAQLTSAMLNLGYTRVTSPIAGRVSRAEVTEGNLVSGGGAGPATLLTTVVSLDPIYADFDGDEQVYLKYSQLAREGERPSSRDARNPVRMGLANEQGYPHEGYMVFVDNQLNPVTGTIRGRAVFENKDGRFTPGLFARLRLLGSGTHRRTLVADSAIGTDQDRKFVLVVDEHNVANYRPVKLGRVIDGLRVVLEGVKPGERIVVNGLQRARPGTPVTPTVVPMDAGAAAPAT